MMLMIYILQQHRPIPKTNNKTRNSGRPLSLTIRAVWGHSRSTNMTPFDMLAWQHNTRLTSCKELSINTQNFQCIGAKVTTRYSTFLDVYSPPGYPGRDFLSELKTLLKKLLRRGSGLIIGGDINIHYITLH